MSQISQKQQCVKPGVPLSAKILYYLNITL